MLALLYVCHMQVCCCCFVLPAVRPVPAVYSVMQHMQLADNQCCSSVATEPKHGYMACMMCCG